MSEDSSSLLHGSIVCLFLVLGGSIPGYGCSTECLTNHPLKDIGPIWDFVGGAATNIHGQVFM